jgi:hypothetical protein
LHGALLMTFSPPHTLTKTPTPRIPRNHRHLALRFSQEITDGRIPLKTVGVDTVHDLEVESIPASEAAAKPRR